MARLKPAYFQTWFRTDERKLPVRFGIVTAYHPMGKRTPLAENRRRDALLRRTLKALGLAHFRVTGGSQDGSHREPGWGVAAASPRIVRALAALSKQNAYFWISNDRVLLGSAAGGRLVSAGSWSSRQAAW